jgi:hypothetical protein
MTKKKLNEKRPAGAGAVAPASPATAADNNLLRALKRNAEKTVEPALKQRLHAAIDAIEARRA